MTVEMDRSRHTQDTFQRWVIDLRWGRKERELPNTMSRLNNTALSPGKEMNMDWVALGKLGTILEEM